MSEKNIIFDLDHTLGFFEQVIHIMNHSYFTCHEVLTFFPECFRPLLLDFLKSLIPYKKSGKVKSILLYSNNNNDEFVKTVIDYIHKMIEYTLFDEIITMEHPLRKKKQKDYEELIYICQGILHEDSVICFIDDKIHPLMNKSNIFFIKCEGYVNIIKHDEMIDRIKQDIPKYTYKKRCLNKNNQQQISRLLTQRIRVFILR
jgi:hypothetical protein